MDFDVIYSYTRAEAILDGVLVDVKPDLVELEAKLSGWPTICFTQALYEDLIMGPAHVLLKQKEKYNYKQKTIIKSEQLERFRLSRLEKVWERFIDMLLINFRLRKSGDWIFKYQDISLTKPTTVKVVISRDENDQEVVTLMKEWED